MKQNITQEQWRELEDSKMEAWLSFYHTQEFNHSPVRPSIGHMIAFLRHLEIKGRYDLQFIRDLILTPETLCDDLWAIVKKQLINFK